MHDELITRILNELNCDTTVEDPALQAFADELADRSLTPERDAEIAAALPVPYTMRVNGRAEIVHNEEDKLLIPRVAYVDACRVGEGDWRTSSEGRRLRKPKKNVVVGTSVEFESDDVAILRFAVLWMRDK